MLLLALKPEVGPELNLCGLALQVQPDRRARRRVKCQFEDLSVAFSPQEFRSRGDDFVRAAFVREGRTKRSMDRKQKGFARGKSNIEGDRTRSYTRGVHSRVHDFKRLFGGPGRAVVCDADQCGGAKLLLNARVWARRRCGNLIRNQLRNDPLLAYF